MNMLEDQLANAAEEARQNVATTGVRPATTVHGRVRRRRVAMGTMVVVGVLGLSGISALIAQDSNGFDAGASAGGSEATVSSTVTTIAPAQAVAPPDILPQYALDLEGWSVGTIVDRPDAHLVYYFQSDNEYAVISIEVWGHAAGDTSNTGLNLDIGSAESTFTPRGTVDLGSGRSADVYEFSDAVGVGRSDVGHLLTWKESDTATTEVVVHRSTFDEAVAIASSVRELSDWEWNTLIEADTDDASLQYSGSVSTTTIVGAAGEELTRAIDRHDDMVLFTRTAESPPEIFECAVDGTVVSENRHESVTNPEVSATPEDALWSFLRQNAAEQGLAIVGYVKLELADESIVFGKPFEGLGEPMVTAITVTESEAGWSATDWSASGC